MYNYQNTNKNETTNKLRQNINDTINKTSSILSNKEYYSNLYKENSILVNSNRIILNNINQLTIDTYNLKAEDQSPHPNSAPKILDVLQLNNFDLTFSVFLIERDQTIIIQCFNDDTFVKEIEVCGYYGNSIINNSYIHYMYIGTTYYLFISYPYDNRNVKFYQLVLTIVGNKVNDINIPGNKTLTFTETSTIFHTGVYEENGINLYCCNEFILSINTDLYNSELLSLNFTSDVNYNYYIGSYIGGLLEKTTNIPNVSFNSFSGNIDCAYFNQSNNITSLIIESVDVELNYINYVSNIMINNFNNNEVNLYYFNFIDTNNLNIIYNINNKLILSQFSDRNIEWEDGMFINEMEVFNLLDVPINYNIKLDNDKIYINNYFNNESIIIYDINENKWVRFKDNNISTFSYNYNFFNNIGSYTYTSVLNELPSNNTVFYYDHNDEYKVIKRTNNLSISNVNIIGILYKNNNVFNFYK